MSKKHLPKIIYLLIFAFIKSTGRSHREWSSTEAVGEEDEDRVKARLLNVN